jgi:hypothetical protein
MLLVYTVLPDPVMYFSVTIDEQCAAKRHHVHPNRHRMPALPPPLGRHGLLRVCRALPTGPTHRHVSVQPSPLQTSTPSFCKNPFPASNSDRSPHCNLRPSPHPAPKRPRRRLPLLPANLRMGRLRPLLRPPNLLPSTPPHRLPHIPHVPHPRIPAPHRAALPLRPPRLARPLPRAPSLRGRERG